MLEVVQVEHLQVDPGRAAASANCADPRRQPRPACRRSRCARSSSTSRPMAGRAAASARPRRGRRTPIWADRVDELTPGRSRPPRAPGRRSRRCHPVALERDVVLVGEAGGERRAARLPAAAQDERRPRRLHRLRQRRRVGQLVVLAREAERLAGRRAPQAVDDLDLLGEPVEALGDRRERDAVGARARRRTSRRPARVRRVRRSSGRPARP